MSETLRELNTRFTFKPHDKLLLDGVRLVEAISYPVPGAVPTLVVRLTPGDPTTLAEVPAHRLAHLPARRPAKTA
jgi:hypothetical protein